MRNSKIIWIRHLRKPCLPMGFPGSASGQKNLPASVGNARDLGLIPRSGRSPGGENGNPCQYSCLENSMAEEPYGLQFVGSQRVRQDWVSQTQCLPRVKNNLPKTTELVSNRVSVLWLMVKVLFSDTRQPGWVKYEISFSWYGYFFPSHLYLKCLIFKSHSLQKNKKPACLFIYLLFIYLFIYLAALGLTWGKWDLVPWPGTKPRTLHWKHEVLAPGPSGNSHLSANSTVRDGQIKSAW